MGNGNSKDNGPETPGLMSKLGGIPRAAAITEGRRAKGGQPKLPPNAVKSQPEDWAFIEVTFSISLEHSICLLYMHSLPDSLPDTACAIAGWQ